MHRALLHTPDGDHEVVVKVQRPGITSTVARDLELLHIMAVALERAVPPAGVSEVSDWVEQFAKEVLVTRAREQAQGMRRERFPGEPSPPAQHQKPSAEIQSGFQAARSSRPPVNPFFVQL